MFYMLKIRLPHNMLRGNGLKQLKDIYMKNAFKCAISRSFIQVVHG